jgi:DNA-binding CsgD family transcriptional regulator
MATTALTAGITSGVEESLATTLAWAQYEAELPVTPRIARNGARTTLERGARSEHAALTALATGRSAEAAARFDHAAVLLAGRAEPYALRARYGASLARIADGDAVRAQIDLLALEHLADAAGMQPLRDRIARALRTTGTRRAARRNGASAPITGREREVLALVAEGATTPEIARTLAIAETTVDTLVANVVRRLGVRSRRHAAAMLAVGRQDPPDLSRDELALVAALAAGASMEDAAAGAGVSLRTAHRRMTALRQRLGARSTTQAVALARQISTTTGRISGRFDARR